MKTILIVDDQAEVRELVEVTLRAEDYRIIQAGNGKEAVETACRERPDLIILDVMMPGEFDGLEASRRIRKDPSTADCQIVMLTAKGQQVDRQAGFNAGADDYFVKPFSPLELIQKVEEMLA